MNAPIVSILMTAFNREKYIEEAIQSVLNSSFTNWELIIVDDCSIDNTVDIAKKYEAKDKRIKVYVNKVNLGDYPNRNHAASFAKGKYLKYLDSDDMLYRHSLQVFVDFMELNPSAAMAIMSPNNSTIQPFPILLSPKESIRRHFFEEHFLDCAPTGTMINRDVFEKLNMFSGIRMIGDIEFGLKCASNFNILIVPPGLVYWREHGNQEVFYGIKNNMYTQMMKDVLYNFKRSVNEDILTNDEYRRITKGSNFINKIINRLKRLSEEWS